jgi:formate dehydrogenase major subunit
VGYPFIVANGDRPGKWRKTLPRASRKDVDGARAPTTPVASTWWKEVSMGRRYERLTRPLIRENGALRLANWDEAVDRVAAGLSETTDRYGPASFGMFSCSKATNEMNFLAQKLARVAIGSNNVDSCNRT